MMPVTTREMGMIILLAFLGLAFSAGAYAMTSASGSVWRIRGAATDSGIGLEAYKNHYNQRRNEIMHDMSGLHFASDEYVRLRKDLKRLDGQFERGAHRLVRPAVYGSPN